MERKASTKLASRLMTRPHQTVQNTPGSPPAAARYHWRTVVRTEGTDICDVVQGSNWPRPRRRPAAEGGHMQRYIAVVGGGTCSAEEAAAAERIGALIARADSVLVCGGLSGVMEAACRGARREGGLTVGLLPGTDRATANPHVAVAIATGLGELRNGLVVRAADAVIAVGGEFGTLSEIGFALKLGKRVVGLGTWDLGRRGEAILRATTPEDAAR